MSTTTKEICMSDQRPEVVTDLALAENWGEVARLRNSLGSIRVRLHHLLGIRSQKVGRSYDYPHSLRTVAAMVEAKLPTMSQWEAPKAREVLDNIVTINDAIEAKYAEAAPLEREYDAKQWSRFFLVQNNNGHIHSSMSCSTCYFDTQFGWLPELSGLTEADAVEAHGAILCSVCFPSAPVEWTNGISHVAQAEKDARAAAKAKRDAAKAAKAITAPDGSPLKDDGGYTIKTEVTARREMSGALENALWYPQSGDKYRAYADRLAEAISAKTGEHAYDLIINAQNKAEKKFKREATA